MLRHVNIPVFVPHLGCGHDCIFCNQRRITGAADNVTPEDVINTIEKQLKTIERANTYIELAFFGGSFTGIDLQKQRELLATAFEYVKNGSIDGIRLSTRPDYINNDILCFLKQYGVTAIELGVQSMDNSVLEQNRRGHTAEQARQAAVLIKQQGFELGLQMMIGLYGSTKELDIYTAKELIALKPDTVRIYPTIVLRDTYLKTLIKMGEYVPIGLLEAVEICKSLVPLFKASNIRIIRIGLQASDNINEQGDIIAGPYHSAFGELVESAVFLDKIINKLNTLNNPTELIIRVNPRDTSRVIGNKRYNINYLKGNFNIKKIKVVQDSMLPLGEFELVI